ncbi:hypothetical protein T12_6836 [Trichinella patagoniensis]|uniref:Uncharacterized protein n=1 Tax=Trichinella patagoniensis TaxID=990121 RepID=A0A0V0YN26_9BILA|nr:hypothetical protein T12_6836 [Trichinella patagoniensis]
MAQNSAAVGEFIVSDHGALSFLFSAISLEQNRDLKMIALKLIYYIAGKHHITDR